MASCVEVIGISKIEAYVPNDRIDVLALAAQVGVDPDLVKSKTGFFRVARRRSDQDTSDLAVEAAEKLFTADPNLRNEIGALAVVTQTPDGQGLPHVSAIVHGRLGLKRDVAAFDISLGCSGWVYALSILKSFMAANEIAHGLLITADCYSKIVDPKDTNTALLFGDAAAATLLSGRDVSWTLGRARFGTEGSRHADLQAKDGRLAMNGRSIFNFSAVQVPQFIADVLAGNNWSADSVDRFLLHQGSKFIVETIGERMGIQDRTPFWASEYGNTVASSLPLMMRQLPAEDKRVVACGFGVGLSWAGIVMEKTNGH